MDGLVQFGETLAANAVLLLILLPLIGAALVRLLRRSGVEAVYYTALTNTWVGVVLALVMVGRFLLVEPAEDSRGYHMTSSVLWLAEPQVAANGSGQADDAMPARLQGLDVRVAVGVDHLTVWFVALIVAVTVVAVSHTRRDERFAARVSLLLLVESALIGSLAALDVILLAFLATLSSIGLFFLIGYSGQRSSREAARRFLTVQTASGFLLMTGLTGAAVSYWWMQAASSVEQPALTFLLPKLLHGISVLDVSGRTSSETWHAVAPVLCLILLTGAALRTGVVPFHGWSQRISTGASSGIAALIAVGVQPLGFVIVARIVLPLLPPDSSGLADFLMWTGAAGAGFCVLASLRAEEARDRLAGIHTAVLSLSFGAIFSRQELVLHGAGLLVLSSSACVALAHLTIPHAPVRSRPAMPVMTRRIRTLLVCAAIGGLAMLPPLPGFIGLASLLTGLIRYDAALAFATLAVVALIGWSSVELVRHVLREEGASADSQRARMSSALIFVPILGLLAGLTVAPGVAMPDSVQEDAAGRAVSESKGNRTATRVIPAKAGIQIPWETGFPPSRE